MTPTPCTRIVLPNGVRLLLIPLPGMQSVATSVMVGVGSRYETQDVSGISHFLEHMVFKGTTKYPTTDDVNAIERIGGLQNAYTDVDITNYHNKVLAEDWKLGLEINKELAMNPLLLQEHVDRERDVIIEEMKRYEDEPASKVGEVFHTLMYPHTALGMRTIGEESSLRTVTSKELREYHDHWYKPNRTVVVLAGGVSDYMQSIKETVNDWFAPVQGTAENAFEMVKDQQEKPALEVITKKEAQQAHLNIGLRTFARTSDEKFAWSVFNILMGVSFSSRLFREIREKKGLCYHIRSGSDNWADVGYWSIYAGVATEKVEEATKGIIEELHKVIDGGVTEDEVAVSKKRLQTMIAFRSEDPEFQNEYYGRQELFDEPLLSLDDYHKKIAAVTKEEIDAMVKKYFVTAHLNMALVWSKPRDEKLLELLKI
jgi:predicted Zn-dependent peptidase